MKAVNPNRKDDSDKRTPDELINLIEQENEKLLEILRNISK